MKKFTLSACMIIFSIAAFAQATLPASWGFPTTTLQTGWTSAGGFAYYAASGSPAPAAKFQSTGAMLTIYFASTPGTLTYDLTGNSFSGGTFIVEESVTGSTWSTVHTFTAPPSGTYTGFSDPLMAA